MCYVDQRHGPFAYGFSMHIGNPVFRDYIMDVPPGDDNTAAGRVIGDDSGILSIIRGGREHHDGFAPPGHGRASYKIHLSADAAIKLKTQGIGAYLSGQIHGERGIDGDHLVILGDHIGIVDILARPEFEEGLLCT